MVVIILAVKNYDAVGCDFAMSKIRIERATTHYCVLQSTDRLDFSGAGMPHIHA